MLHVELGNIICLLPLIERASLGWDRWDLMGILRGQIWTPSKSFVVREEQHAICTTSNEKEQRLTVQHKVCKIIFFALPFRKGCWAVGSSLAGEHKLLLEQLRPLQPMLRSDGREQS